MGLRLQRYTTNTKRYSPKKVFGNSEFFPPKPQLETIRPTVLPTVNHRNWQDNSPPLNYTGLIRDVHSSISIRFGFPNDPKSFFDTTESKYSR